MTAGEHLGDVLSALLDGELDPDAVARAEAHLATCSHCRAEHEGTRAVREAVRLLSPLDPPFGLIERLVLPGGLEQAVRRTIGSRRPVLVAGIAAAAALVALAAAPRHSSRVQPPVATFVDAHTAASPGADPVSELVPVATPVSFRSP